MQWLPAFVLTTQDYYHHHQYYDQHDYYYHHHHNNVGLQLLLLPVACVCGDDWSALG